MKKKRSLLFGLALFAMSLTSCGGITPLVPGGGGSTNPPEQEETDQRYEIYMLAKAAGYQGTYEEWLESIKGADGSSVLNGTNNPSSYTGKDGDMYINTTTWDVYVKKNGTWTKVGNIKGETGQSGKDGQDGQDGQAAARGDDGLTPYIGDNGNWWIGTTDTGVKAAGTDGVDGTDGKDGVDGQDGKGIKSVYINGESELIIVFDDNTTYNAGKIDSVNHKHEYEVEIVEATCTTDGSVTLTCKTCGHVEIVINKAQGHQFESWKETVPASCTNEGKKSRQCMLCGLREEETIPMHDHQPSSAYSFNAATHWHYCELCGVTLDEHDHSFIDKECSECHFVKSDSTAGDGMIYSLTEDEQGYVLADYGTNTETDVVVPEMYNGKPVVAIGEDAFSNSKLTSIIIPDTVTKIGRSAFKNCNKLISVVLSKNIKRLENNVFQGCSLLKSINIPNSVQIIKEYAFNGCYSLQSVVLPNSVVYVGSNSFSSCSELTKVVLSSNLSVMEWYAFGSCGNLKEIIIPEGCKVIGGRAFCYSSIESIYLPVSLRRIGDYAFDGCNQLQSVTFADPTKWYSNNEIVAKEILQNDQAAARKLIGSASNWFHKSDFNHKNHTFNIVVNGTTELTMNTNGDSGYSVYVGLQMGDSISIRADGDNNTIWGYNDVENVVDSYVQGGIDNTIVLNETANYNIYLNFNNGYGTIYIGK